MSTQIVPEINVVEHADGELRVSSLIIAGRTENQHKNVLGLIRSNQADLEEFGRVAFETRTLETAGGTQRREVAHLNEQQATLLITFMRNSEIVKRFKVELVKQFYAMRQALSTPALPNARQLALMVIQAEDARAAAEKQVAELTPKADYVDTFVADSDLRLLRNVAKSLGMTEKELRADLVGRAWIYEERSTRWSEKEQAKVPMTRYSAYSHKSAYFTPVPVHDAPRFKGEVMHTLKVTPQGALAIARLYGKHLTAVAS